MNKKGNWSHIQKMKGHKSGLETRIDEQLKAQGIDGEYEQYEVSYTVPAIALPVDDVGDVNIKIGKARFTVYNLLLFVGIKGHPFSKYFKSDFVCIDKYFHKHVIHLAVGVCIDEFSSYVF